MYVCQWHLDIPYGKQKQVVEIMTAWGAEKLRSSDFKKVKSTRLLVGHIGDSASHIVDEYVFETLADFESALAGMGQPQFKPHSDALAPFIIPGSQKWVVYRIIG
jgi:hypothetical protein